MLTFNRKVLLSSKCTTFLYSNPDLAKREKMGAETRSACSVCLTARRAIAGESGLERCCTAQPDSSGVGTRCDDRVPVNAQWAGGPHVSARHRTPQFRDCVAG